MGRRSSWFCVVSHGSKPPTLPLLPISSIRSHSRMTPTLVTSFDIYNASTLKDFYELSLDLEDLVLPAIERESQGPGQKAVPKRKSLLQKKLAAKSAIMVQDIVGTGQEGGMGDVSFGGQFVRDEAAPPRPSGGCPVAHTASSSHDASHSTDQAFVAATSGVDDDSEPLLSSQPLREKKADTLPEIQVRSCTVSVVVVISYPPPTASPISRIWWRLSLSTACLLPPLLHVGGHWLWRASELREKSSISHHQSPEGSQDKRIY